MSIWHLLLTNLALAALVVIIIDHGVVVLARLPLRLQSCLKGVLMGCAAVAAMVMVPAVTGGAMVDLRTVFVAAAGFFCGPLAGAISTVIAVAFRFSVGGETAYVGAINIVLAFGAGISARYLLASQKRPRWELLAFALPVTVTNLLTYFVLPFSVALDLLARTGLPYLSLSFVGALFIGYSIRSIERRHALEKSNVIYRTMVEQLPDALNFKDTDGRFIVANPATARNVGAEDAESLIGKTDFDLHPREIAERYHADEMRLLQNRDITRLEQPSVFANGRSGWVSTLKAPLFDERGKVLGLITHNRDITQERANAEAKNEFISVVSHELRTPLTSIRGALGLLRSGKLGSFDAKASSLLKIAHTNTDRLLLLVNDILDMEKIQSGKLEFLIRPESLEPLVEQAIAASNEYCPDKKIAIEFVNDFEQAVADVDPDRLHQVLGNLLSNALKFSPQASTVTVRLAEYDGVARISVQDRGPGIPKDFQPRLFNKFEQATSGATRNPGGTGLGLCIAKSIVETMGGRIDFETADNIGTTFHVELPLSNASVGATSAEETSASVAA
ncbi:ATP-binding protein [Fulvimarina sp. MAC8]|uniref:ATP-binding protein n=1 Tax=Fulvimarina sp. MAC8 TaxID=3162874 RepID=UPI0032EF9774